MTLTFYRSGVAMEALNDLLQLVTRRPSLLGVTFVSERKLNAWAAEYAGRMTEAQHADYALSQAAEALQAEGSEP